MSQYGFSHQLVIAATAAFFSMTIPAVVKAQEAPSASVEKTESASAYTQAQLDQMLAPIALYPDAVLDQILVASGYPLEVVKVNRWLQDQKNAALKGGRLAAALKKKTWDPSVKSLVSFPQILQMMDNNLEWTEQLGDAFLNDPSAVMDSVQRLRAQAKAAGTLQSTPQQAVIVQDQDILIEPTDYQMVYIPDYDPGVVYGDWIYPDYPPFFFGVVSGFGHERSRDHNRDVANSIVGHGTAINPMAGHGTAIHPSAPMVYQPHQMAVSPQHHENFTVSQSHNAPIFRSSPHESHVHVQVSHGAGHFSPAPVHVGHGGGGHISPAPVHVGHGGGGHISPEIRR